MCKFTFHANPNQNQIQFNRLLKSRGKFFFLKSKSGFESTRPNPNQQIHSNPTVVFLLISLTPSPLIHTFRICPSLEVGRKWFIKVLTKCQNIFISWSDICVSKFNLIGVFFSKYLKSKFELGLNQIQIKSRFGFAHHWLSFDYKTKLSRNHVPNLDLTFNCACVSCV